MLDAGQTNAESNTAASNGMPSSAASSALRLLARGFPGSGLLCVSVLEVVVVLPMTSSKANDRSLSSTMSRII